MSDDLSIPQGMKAWHGGDCAPIDWDGGPVLLATGAMIDNPYTWASHYSEDYLAPSRVAAYTPKGLISNETLPSDDPSDDIAKRMEALVRAVADETSFSSWMDHTAEARAIVALLPEPIDHDLAFAREIIADAVSYGEQSVCQPEAKTSRDFRSGECDAGDLIARVVKQLRIRALERDSREG